ncbi:universal stress protein [Tahibacter amnicola]|uniref:Universal stress protein n=1 Tax=Tahibacter amnicola TaxID=2976241 RepID=A0ABY6BIA1_9GAMM|nr:universal stress protein [Tahibacter amnicola]UXI69073.1 universal stress protein [Tahibacter amnicola]
MRALDVLVHVRHYAGDSPTFRAALALGRRVPGRLHGLYVAPIPPAAFTSPETVAVLVHESDRRYRGAQSAEAWWQELLAMNAAEGDWTVAQADAIDAIASMARWIDLIVIERAQHQAEAPVGWGLVSRSVLAVGVPVVVVPEGVVFDELGRHIVVLWNGSREATRAVHGALPFLLRAEAVTVIDGEAPTNNGGILHLPRFDLRRYLQAHGVRANFRPFTAESDRGAALMAAVKDAGADLVVMGAWGHSRLTELVLGGATRYLFQHADRPLLVAH